MSVVMPCWCRAEVMRRSCWGHFWHRKCPRGHTKGTFLCWKWPQGGLSMTSYPPFRLHGMFHEGFIKASWERAQTVDQLSGTFAQNINFRVWKWVPEHIQTGWGRIVFLAPPLSQKRYFCLPAAPTSDQKADHRTDLPQTYIFIICLSQTNPRKPSNCQVIAK